MKTVIIFSQNSYPSSFADAVRISPIVEFLTRNRFFVKLITQTKGNFNENERIVLTRFKPNNKDKILVRLLKEVLLGIQLFFHILRLNKADYYLLTSPPFLSCLLASFAVIIRRGKLIFDVRDIYPDIYAKQGVIKEGGIIHKSLLFFERTIYLNSFMVLTATDGLHKNVQKKLPNTHAKLFRNGYSKEFYKDEKYKDKFYIVFHGALSRFQNIELLVKIINEIQIIEPKIHFIVVGSGPKEDLIKEMNAENLTFRGRLSNSETARIVNKCHLGLSLRDDSEISREAFPVKLYEYIGAQIPSISTPINEGGQVIEKLKMGFNFENDERSVIETILKLQRDVQYYNTLVSSISKHNNDFKREEIVERTFACLL